MQPLSVAFFTYFFVASEPTANSAISIPLKSKVSKSLVFRTLSPNEHSVPKDLLLAKAVSSSTGNRRSAKILSISLPTLPVAPQTAMLYPILFLFNFLKSDL